MVTKSRVSESRLGSSGGGAQRWHDGEEHYLESEYLPELFIGGCPQIHVGRLVADPRRVEPELVPGHPDRVAAEEQVAQVGRGGDGTIEAGVSSAPSKSGGKVVITSGRGTDTGGSSSGEAAAAALGRVEEPPQAPRPAPALPVLLAADR